MEDVLLSAYELCKKYGISLNSFGPYISYVDNKVGICLSLREEYYGILTRNFSFDSIDEFESFLKRYVNFKNAKGNPSITFDDYLCEAPNIIFSNEQENVKELEVKDANISILKDCLNSFKEYFDNIFNYRLVKLQKREKNLINAHHSLNEYKKNLHKYYGSEFIFEDYQNDDVISKFEEKYNSYLNLFRDIETHIFDEYNLEQINNDFEKIISLFKDFELDREYFDNVFDLSICQNRMLILNDMNNLLIQKLESNEKKDYILLKNELDSIQNNKPFLDKKDTFIRDNFNEINDKYDGFNDNYYFNFINYINNKDYVSLNLYVSEDMDSTIREDAKYNDNTILLYSPLRSILAHILFDISIGKKNVDYSEYLPLYNEVKEKIEMPVNVLVAQKYFNNVNFDTFNEFVESLTNICNNIFESDKKYDYILVDDEVLYSYDYNTNYLFCSNKIIKDSSCDVVVLKAKKGTKVFYNSRKIVYNSKDLNSMIVVKNDDYVIDSRINNVINNNSEIFVNDYSTVKEKKNINGNNLNIVVGFNKNKTYSYKFLEIE